MTFKILFRRCLILILASSFVFCVSLLKSTHAPMEAASFAPVNPSALQESFSRSINFQPASGSVPVGYMADTGAAYSAGRGYGWVKESSLEATTPEPLDITPNTRRRNLQADARLDTFVHMQFPAAAVNQTAIKEAAAWEMAVANGAYDVTVGVGDAGAFYDSVHRLNVEGQVAVADFVPSAGERHRVARLTVNVADGKLTLDAIGGSNTKLDFVVIEAVGVFAGQLEVTPSEAVYSTVKGTVTSAQTILLSNRGNADIQVSNVSLTGANASSFRITDAPTLPFTIPANQSVSVSVAFSPNISTVGALNAVLQITSNDAGRPVIDFGLFGLSANGKGGVNEPPLKQVVDTLGYPVNVGGSSLIIGTASTPIGDEIRAPLFIKAGDGAVTLKPVARYSPNETLPFGYYTSEFGTPVLNQTGVIAAGQEQTLNPSLAEGGNVFDPLDKTFGIYVESNTFNRKSFTQDELNTGIPHAARIYPVKNRQGQSVANNYLVAFEDASNGDYQDYVFLLSNVSPVPLPAAPSNLNGILRGTTAIDLSWQDNAADESLQRIERSTDGGTTWITVAEVGANATSASDTNVSSGGTYKYSVRAVNPVGASNTSNIAEVVVPSSSMDSGSSVLLETAGDAYVRDGTAANSNFGTSVELVSKLNSSAGNNRQAYLKFDLSGIAGVTNAKLRMYGRLQDTRSGSTQVGVFGVADLGWTETGITWNNKPASNSTAAATVTVTDDVARWYEWDVTNLVAAEKNSGRTAIGFALKNMAVTLPYITWNSREAGFNAPQLVVSNYSVKINFQPATVAVPSGYVVDSGAAYGVRGNGQNYGWSAGISANTRDRNAANSPDQRYDTLIATQLGGVDRTWELGVANGTYQVRVVAGDASYFDSTYRVAVEGVLTVNGVPTSGNRWIEGTQTVSVTDGKLTVTNAAGAVNNKLCFVEIVKVGSDNGFAWREVTPSPIARFEGASVVANGKLYIFGGFYDEALHASRRVDAFDLTTETWTRQADMPIAVTHITAALDGETVWIAGGFRGDHPGPTTADVWKYNITTNIWSAAPALPQPRSSGGFIKLGRNLHYFGGFKDRDATAGEHWTLSLDGGTAWQGAALLPNPRGHLGGIELAGKIYAVGGQYRHDTNPDDLNLVHRYDVSINQWIQVTPLPNERSHFESGIFVYNNRVVVAGGRSNGVSGVTALSDMTQYDPATNSWSVLGALPKPLRAPHVHANGAEIIVSCGANVGSTITPQPQTWRGARVAP